MNNLLSLNDLLNSQEFLLKSSKECYNYLIEKDGVCFDFIFKKVVLALLDYYDKSHNINSFYYKGKEEWLDKNTRIGLQTLINSGADIITILLKDSLLNIQAGKLKEFLNLLEIYAGKCFAVTAKHRLDILNLYSLEDLLNYDFKSGYPEKITLNE